MKTMKKNYPKKILKNLLPQRILLFFVLAFIANSSAIYGQTITYSFANAKNTNDGTDDYFEADIVLTTDTDFKLGAGQFYLDYNTAAFGNSIHGGNLTFSHPVGAATSYVLDEQIFGGALNGYAIVNANSTTSKLSISWSTAIAGQVTTNVTVASSPNLICHIKIKYVDVNESPDISFDDTTSPDTVTSFGLTFTDGGTQLTSDSYDSSGASLPVAVTWDGSQDSDWATAANWGGGSVPSATDDVVIANAGTAPIITTGITVNDLTIEASATLTVQGSGSLSVDGDLTVDGSSTLTINSDATTNGSLLVAGSSTGNITYNRHVTYSAASAEGWYLISSPFSGETEDDVITNGSLLTNGSSLKSIATYNNSYSGSNGWEYLAASASGAMSSGKGYSAKSTASSIPFTGAMKTDDLSDYAITVGTQNSWNLIGNPFPSFVAANISANGTNNFITANISELDASFVAVYTWNSASLTYDVINNASGAHYIAPGQGFFVNAKAGGGMIDITESMLSHQSGDLFLKNATAIPQVKLKISNGSTSKSTDIKYIQGTTTGLDVGYDAGVFNGTSRNFSVYSHLISDSKGIDFTLQCLPTNNYENMIIPIGIKADSGTQVTFSSELINLPLDLNVYLEDKKKNVITKLNNSRDYTVTLDEAETTIGRFYLHTTPQTLNISKIDLLNVSVYRIDGSKLRIAGLQNEDVYVEVYNILGKRFVNKSYKAKSADDIELPIGIAEGIYIVKVNTAKGKLSKKIIID